MRIALTHDYDVPARAVWRICTDLGALETVCKPLLAFDGLPSGSIRAGQSLSVEVRLFGVLPSQTYHMLVERCDVAAMRFQSREHGAGVTRWDHRLRVLPVGETGARIEEVIEIEAGVLTPLYAAWARLLYGHRHKGRLRLLSKG